MFYITINNKSIEIKSKVEINLLIPSLTYLFTIYLFLRLIDYKTLIKHFILLFMNAYVYEI